MKYAKDGQRLTDCCGAYSTYCEGMLCCKKCYYEVPLGQGDGSEYKDNKEPDKGRTKCPTCCGIGWIYHKKEGAE